MPLIVYREITVTDPEYRAEKELRNRVLRVPLGLTLSARDVRDDHTQLHVMALEAGQPVGCVLVAFDGTRARMRQMAVDEQHQRQGIGTELVRCAERAALMKGVRIMTLHARVTARSFYERMGYRVTSEPFFEVTVPHLAMEKEFIDFV